MPLGQNALNWRASCPAAEKTGNMTIRPFSVVHSIIFDPETKKASGVRVLDDETGESLEFFARIIFCCASALGTTHILLNSASEHHPDGLGNSKFEWTIDFRPPVQSGTEED